MFPLVLSGIGIIASVIGIFMVRGKEGSNPANALNMGTYVAGIIVIIATVILSKAMLGSVQLCHRYHRRSGRRSSLSVRSQKSTLPVITNPLRRSQNSLETGSATTIISGLGVGMMSTAIADHLHRSRYIVAAYCTAGLYGIALSAVGMLSTTGMTVAVDAYGPVSDNAGGIAEMSELPGTRKRDHGQAGLRW